MNPFEILVYNLNQLGFYGFLLPWIFTFAVIWALLVKTKLLGDDQKVIGIVSLVIAFFITGFGAVPLGQFLTDLFGMAVMIIAAILIIMLFAAMAGFDITKLADNKAILAAAIAVGLIVVFTVGVGGAMRITINETTIATIFMVIILIAAVYFIAGQGNGGG
jgi:MFS family permease